MTPLQRIWNKPNVTMQEIRQFIPDSRLTSPLAICSSHDALTSFGEYVTYPEVLCEVFLYNNF